ncbi:MAG: heme biosynthesis HemY N-terminal domain-containing protein [Hyphomicrobiaceae bacterium]
MLRLVLYLVLAFAIASGLAWLADRPGDIVLTWQGYRVETSVFRAIVMLGLLLALAVMLWSLARNLWRSPALLGRMFSRRREQRGLEALSAGIIAIGAGDRTMAQRYSTQARKSLPNEPLTQLLRAQAAQLSGDRATARRIFESMLNATDTEQLGLRGLFLEAMREGETEAAEQFAERALRLNPKLDWPSEALLEAQCKKGDWDGALDTLAVQRRNQIVDRATSDRRRAVLLTALATEIEDTDMDRALELASEAHNLAPDLVPAATIAGRILASKGSTPRAAKVLQRTWKRSPHPDIADTYAYARTGDSPRDRLQRVKELARQMPHSIEGPIAVARAAIEALDIDEARKALEPLRDERQTQRVCTLMARIEGEQGDRGRVREWLARAVNAPRDPAWTADGVVSAHWAAVSPVTGQLDAFRWKVPVESVDTSEREVMLSRTEELLALGKAEDQLIEAKPVAARPARSTEAAVTITAAPATAAPEAPPPAPEPPQAATAPAAASPPAAAAAAPDAPVKADIVPVAAPPAQSRPARPTASVTLGPLPSEPASTQPSARSDAAKAAATPAPSESTKPDRRDAELHVGTGAPAVPAKSAAAPRQEKDTPSAEPPGRAKSRPSEPQIFISPRPPDDPGPEPVDVDPDHRRGRPYRT